MLALVHCTDNPASNFKECKAYAEDFLNKMKSSNKAIYIVGDTDLIFNWLRDEG